VSRRFYSPLHSYNLHAYFVTYLPMHPVIRRDSIVRFLANHQTTQSIINLFPEDEVFSNQAYEFIVPWAVGRNVHTTAPEALSLELGKVSRPALVVFPDRQLADPAFVSALRAAETGTVPADPGRAPFGSAILAP